MPTRLNLYDTFDSFFYDGYWDSLQWCDFERFYAALHRVIREPEFTVSGLARWLDRAIRKRYGKNHGDGITAARNAYIEAAEKIHSYTRAAEHPKPNSKRLLFWNVLPYCLEMAQQELESLRNLVLQAQQIVATVELPPGPARRLREVLDAAVALADDIVKTPPAAALGSRGGQVTAKRGPEYFAKIAAMRKTKAGGRPKKNPGSVGRG